MFADKYNAKHDKAVACLTKDREALLAFFDFPAEHWDHLRTSNPIESVFATVRHRTVRTKGALSAKTAKLMVFKLVNAGAKNMTTIEGRKSVAESRPRRDVVIGGGNVKKLKKLLLGCRAGHNNNAFLGGFRLEPREAHVPEANHKPSELMPHSHSAARSQVCRLRR